MIYYRLRGHELQNDVQTMVQVFYPNLHYYRTEEISAEETTVESSVEKGIASAMLIGVERRFPHGLCLIWNL